jgi:integrase
MNPQSAAELARLLHRLLITAEEPVPLCDWRDQVLAGYADSPRSTRTRMKQALAEAIALAGETSTTAELTAELVGRFAKRKGAPSTTNGLLASLRTACRAAAAKHQLDVGRLEGAPWRVKGDGSSARARHHPRTAIARVLESLEAASASWHGGRLWALGAVYAYAGLRLREGLRLKVGDVDLDRGFLFVRRNGEDLKTEKSAAPVPCPRALLEVLESWIPRTGSEWLVPKLSRSGPWLGGTYGKRPTDALVAAGKLVGVEGFTPLSLRHSLATHYASYWGLSEKQIQQILRHTSICTQRHYVHPDLINLGELVRDFGFNPPRPPRPKSTHRRHGPHRFFAGRKRRRPPSAIDAQVLGR